MECCKIPQVRLTASQQFAQRQATICVDAPRLGYYSYHSANSKTPKVRPKYRIDPARPAKYYNLMWDPHVYRGDTFNTFQKVESDRKKELEKDKRKKKLKKLPPRTLGGIEIPKTPPPSDTYKKNLEAQQKFLVEVEAPVEEFDASTQTDLINEVPKSPLEAQSKIGYDASTQILPGEMFDFDVEVAPIVDTMSWKILEQALLEFSEEEELRILTSEQRMYEERRRLEALRLKRLAEREQEMFSEREALMALMKKQLTEEKESEERVGAFLFSCSYLKELVPNCLETLETEGFLHNLNITEMTEMFMPWLENQVTVETSQQKLSRALADDIIENVASKRQTEYVNSQNAQDSTLQLQPEYEYEGEGE